MLAGARPAGEDLLVERLAAGGAGVVYRALRRGPCGDLSVALKRKPGPSIELPFALPLSHVNLARPIDCRMVGDSASLAVEWLEGTDLARLCAAGGPLPPAAAAFVIAEAARGLAFLHGVERNGVALVHGHLSPRKLLLGESGDVKVAGIEHALASHRAPLDAETVAFAAPERLAGEPLDARADLFSLAALLHFSLTGAPPRAVSTTLASRSDSLTPASRSDSPDPAAPLFALIRRASPTDRALRPPSALALRDALLQFVDAQDPIFDRAALAELVHARRALRPSPPPEGDLLDDGEPPEDSRRWHPFSPARAWAVRRVTDTAEEVPAVGSQTVPLDPPAPARIPASVVNHAPRPAPSPADPSKHRPRSLVQWGVPFLLAGSTVAIAVVIGLAALASTNGVERTAGHNAMPAPVTVVPQVAASSRMKAVLVAAPQVGADSRMKAVLAATSAAICATPRGTVAPCLPSELREEVRRAGAEQQVADLVRAILAGQALPPPVIAAVDAQRTVGAGGGLAALSVLAHPDDAALRAALVREQLALHRFAGTGAEPSVAELCDPAAAVRALTRLAPSTPLSHAADRWLARAAASSAASENVIAEGDLRYRLLSTDRADSAIEILLRIDNLGAQPASPRLDRMRIEAPPEALPSFPGHDSTPSIAEGTFREVRVRFALPSAPNAVPALVLQLPDGASLLLLDPRR